jgi:hypothetical protein
VFAAGNVGAAANGETGLKQAAGVFALLACFAFGFGLQWFVGLCGAESGFLYSWFVGLLIVGMLPVLFCYIGRGY